MTASATHTEPNCLGRRPLADRLMLRVAVAHSRRLLERFQRDAARATQVQQRVLDAKIRRNADSALGRDFGFGKIRTYADFCRQVPIMRYDDLAPYVQRVMDGETGAMFAGRQRVYMLAKTSGTSDKPKYIPVTTPFLHEYRRGWNVFGVKAIMDHSGCFLRHIVQMASPMDEERSAGGLCCGAITGLMAQFQKRLVRRYYVVPPAVGYIDNPTARYYTAMRFAVPKDVAFMITASPATQLNLVQTADRYRDVLIRDIHDGRLSHRFEVSRSMRVRLEPHLTADPATARRLERSVARTNRLLPVDYWRLGFVANWMGGTMGLYLRAFPEYFGDTPVRDIGLLASEGRMSIPMQDGTPGGVLEFTASFFEFIPQEEYGRRDPTVLRSHELQVGRRYFILLTTSAGFYRYDIGDCVRVTGFQGQAPIIEFLHKRDGISSLTGEKLTEQQAVEAMQRCTTTTDVGSFVLAPHWADPPFYMLHVDRSVAPTPVAQQALADRLDRVLQQVNIEYASKRHSGRLGIVLVNVVDADCLARRDRELARRYRRANEQYKHRFLLSKIGDDADLVGETANEQPTRRRLRAPS